MKRLLSALALAVLSTSAFAGWVDITTNFLDLFGLVDKVYIKVPVTTSTNKNVNVLLPLHDLTEDEIRLALAEQGKLPPSNAPTSLEGPYRFVFKDYSGAKSYTASGATLAEFRNAIALCPSDVCTSTTVQGGGYAFSGTTGQTALNAGAMARNLAAVTISAPVDYFYNNVHYYQLRLDFGGYTMWMEALPSGVTCPGGYKLNAVTGKCDLSSVSEAAFSQGDGVCLTYVGVPALSDPDCQLAKADNKLTTSTSSTGDPAVSVSSNIGTVITQTVKPDNSSTVSKLVQTADGGSRREDTYIAPNGAIGTTNTTNFPASPPPLYPGDPGGTAVPGGTGTGSTVTPCGGSGQPACSVNVSQMGDLVSRVDNTNGQLGTINQTLQTINQTLSKQGTSGDGSPVDTVGDGLPSDLQDSVSDLKAKAGVIPVSSYCPPNMFSFTIPLPAIAGGDYQLTDHGLFCQLMGDYQELIRGLSIAFGFIVATFIVLGA